MAEPMRLQLSHLRVVPKPAPPPLERIDLRTLILCYRDRVNARKQGVTRLADIGKLRQHAELYRRDCMELWALVNELDRLEAAHG
jgi:hypothetical protein